MPRWTDDELALVRDTTLTDREIAERIGRSVTATRAKRLRIGVLRGAALGARITVRRGMALDYIVERWLEGECPTAAEVAVELDVTRQTAVEMVSALVKLGYLRRFASGPRSLTPTALALHRQAKGLRRRHGIHVETQAMYPLAMVCRGMQKYSVAEVQALARVLARASEAGVLHQLLTG